MDLAVQEINKKALEERLAILYTAVPYTKEQKEKRELLIKDIETQLGMRELSVSALVENGELDDVEGFRK